MVKLAGPMMSLAASGTLADAVTFSVWKGRAYARQRVIPANPESDGQVGVRAMMSALSKAWAVLDSTMQGYWDDLAKATNISAFNAFVQFNLLRFAQFKAPVLNPDDTNASGTPPDVGAATAVAGIKSATITIPYVHQFNCFGSWVFRSRTTPVVPSRSTLVHGLVNPSSSDDIWVDAPLAAGTYYYWPHYSIEDGVNFENIAATLTVVIA